LTESDRNKTVTETDRHRHRHTQTEREIQRETHTYRERERETHTHRERDRQRQRQKEREGLTTDQRDDLVCVAIKIKKVSMILSTYPTNILKLKLKLSYFKLIKDTNLHASRLRLQSEWWGWGSELRVSLEHRSFFGTNLGGIWRMMVLDGVGR